MDRLDSLAIFVAVAEEGSFIAAARRLGRSPTAVTRAVAALEERLALRLLTRTTRAMTLTEAGQRYLEQGRRALAEFDELDNAATDNAASPRGLLTLTAPEMFGRMHVLPIVQGFMREHPQIDVSLVLLNRIVSYIDEGIDLGFRIAHPSDSSLRATGLGVVRRVLCASPRYLAAAGEPTHPDELQFHQTIAVTGTRPAPDRWRFGAAEREVAVQVKPRLAVNTVQAALDAAAADGGIVRVLSYQLAPLEEAGLLRRVLVDYEPPPIPIQAVYPAGRYLPLKTRLFIDRAVAALRGTFS
jgi:DNA-binding transcriptional LysR family regulator